MGLRYLVVLSVGLTVLLLGACQMSSWPSVLGNMSATSHSSIPVLQLDQIPVVFGETPANDANAIVGTWHSDDLVVTSDGTISGELTLTFDDRSSGWVEVYQEVLMIQVWATYVWPSFGDTLTKAASDPIPVIASGSSDTSSTFNVEGRYKVPPLELDIDGGMPLYYLSVTMIYMPTYLHNGNLTGWAGAKLGTPSDFAWDLRSWEDVPKLDHPMSLTGTIDTNVRGDFVIEYSAWITENMQFTGHIDLQTHLSPLPTSRFVSPLPKP